MNNTPEATSAENNFPSTSLDINAPVNVAVPSVVIDWNRSTPWIRPLMSTLPIAWRASHLLLAGAGVLLTVLYTQGVLALLGNEEDNVSLITRSQLGTIAEGHPFSDSLTSSLLFFNDQYSFLGLWGRFMTPLLAWFVSPTLSGLAIAVAMFLGLIAIWGFLGGCLVRRTIVEVGTRSVPSWKDTVRVVRSRWVSILWALSMPVLAVALLCLIPLTLGAISNIPMVGPWVAGVSMILVGICALAFGWTAAVTLLGFPLSIAAVVTENKADAFDGVSRAAAYLFQRPILFLLYAMFFELVSRVGGGLFSFVASMGYRFVNSAFMMSSWGAAESELPISEWMFSGTLSLVVAAFAMSYFWTSCGVLYLLVRKSVDSAELDAIDLSSPTVRRSSDPSTSNQVELEPVSTEPS